MSLRFESPEFFLLIILVLALFFYQHKKGQKTFIYASSLQSLKNFPQSFVIRTRLLPDVLKYLSIFFIIIALARPQAGVKHLELLTEGINIILAIDTSESMKALDFKKDNKVVNRLEALKMVVNEFIKMRTNDRIGMVVFGSYAYSQVPLTRDYNTISFILNKIQIGHAGQRTAIGDGIGIALKRLKDLKSKSNIIILLTDGESNSGEISPNMASNLAKDMNVKIYTIGIGSKGEVPFLINDPIFGQRYIYQQVNIDERSLKEIAQKTGGLYFKAENTQALEEICKTIDKLEKSKVKVKSFAEYKDCYQYPLYIAILLFILFFILKNTKYAEITDY